MISIITPVLNRSKTIQDAVLSVSNQAYSSFEHIIVDGGSTDGTMEILGRFGHLKVTSEHDAGMYDALNKGLKSAQGEIVGFLNSDDVYAEGALRKIDESFKQNPHVNVVIGAAQIFEQMAGGRPKVIGAYPKITSDDLLPQVTLRPPAFNTWFFRTSRIKELGAFNLNYPIAADRELLIRLSLEGWRYVIVDEPVYLYRRHSESQTIHAKVRVDEPYELENLTLCTNLLNDQQISIEQKRVLVEWHSSIAARLCVRNLAHMRFYTMRTYYHRGKERNARMFLFIYKALLSGIRFRLGLAQS